MCLQFSYWNGIEYGIQGYLTNTSFFNSYDITKEIFILSMVINEAPSFSCDHDIMSVCVFSVIHWLWRFMYRREEIGLT